MLIIFIICSWFFVKQNKINDEVLLAEQRIWTIYILIEKILNEYWIYINVYDDLNLKPNI